MSKESLSKELMLEIMPLEFNEEYDEYYETKIGNSLSIGYCYNIVYNGTKVGFGAKHFNIHELAYMGKKWALDNNFHIYSKTMKNKGVAKIRKLLNGKHRKNTLCSFIDDTEVEAIFLVCQWILDNKKRKLNEKTYCHLKKNIKDDILNEFTYDIKIPGESKALTEKFETGEFILFGNIPEIGWVKVYYQSIGLLSEYKLVRKKVFPVVMICGNCAYFVNGVCIHPSSRDNCGDNDSDRKCYHNGFVSVPYNWDSYSCNEKEMFRLHKRCR